MAIFPTSPANGIVHIKDGIRYKYYSSDNTWRKEADPNLISGNIKNGIEINGVTGSLPSGATLPSGHLYNGYEHRIGFTVSSLTAGGTGMTRVNITRAGKYLLYPLVNHPSQSVWKANSIKALSHSDHTWFCQQVCTALGLTYVAHYSFYNGELRAVNAHPGALKDYYTDQLGAGYFLSHIEVAESV